jgi:hypothetical protein
MIVMAPLVMATNSDAVCVGTLSLSQRKSTGGVETGGNAIAVDEQRLLNNSSWSSNNYALIAKTTKSIDLHEKEAFLRLSSREMSYWSTRRSNSSS